MANDCQQCTDQSPKSTDQYHTSAPHQQVCYVGIITLDAMLLLYLRFQSCCPQTAAYCVIGMQEKPLFRFGIISDIQYADIKNGHSFHGIPRYYKASLEGLRRSVTAWQQQQVEFAVQCGDIIDGFNPKEQSETAMQSVLDELAKLQKPVYHMIGNHCLYNLPRQRLNELLSIKSKASYYSFSPHKAWRFVVIDGYDVSMLGWPEGHPLHTKAKAILDEKNVNEASVCQNLTFVICNLGSCLH